jgi:acetyl esterase/lipase
MSDEEILDRPATPADARIAYGDDPYQFGELRLPTGDGPHPVVVYVHGGYWRARYDLTHAGHACAALTARGLATWNLEYRRLGNVGGGWPGTFLDVAAGADFVRELATRYPLDLARVVVVGHSAGGQLACWLAARPRLPTTSLLYTPNPQAVRAAVALAGVLDLARAWELRLSANVTEELLGGAPREVPERYASSSPLALLPLGVPQTLLHGTADDSVPYELSQRYAAEAKRLGDDVTLLTLPGTGHFEVIAPTSAEWPTVARAVLDAAK